MHIDQRLKNRVVITAEDDPITLIDAFLDVHGFFNSEAAAGRISNDRAWGLNKQAIEVREYLQMLEGAGFRPEGWGEQETAAWTSPEIIEYALVYHGVKRINEGRDVGAVETLLQKVAELKASS